MDALLSQTFQTFSCLCLGGFLLLQWIVLRTLVQETLVLKQVYEPSQAPPAPDDMVLGLRAPVFRAPLLDSSEVFTERDLLGRMTTLLFVLPSQLCARAKSQFAPVLHSIWHQDKGPVYVVCSGSTDACQQLRDTYHLGKAHNSKIDIIHDETSALRMTFSVTSTLSALVIDENARVIKVGGALADEPDEVQLEPVHE